MAGFVVSWFVYVVGKFSFVVEGGLHCGALRELDPLRSNLAFTSKMFGLWIKAIHTAAP